MKILSVASDGAGRALLAATRAPDLWRRDIAALTGQGHLRFVALAPDGVSIDDLLARLDARLAKSGAAPAAAARYANTPTRVLHADPERIAHWLRIEIARAGRPAGHPARLLARLRAGVMRSLRRSERTLLTTGRGSAGSRHADLLHRLIAQARSGRG